LIEEKDLSGSLLKKRIAELISDKSRLSKMGSLAKILFPVDSGKKLAREVECLYKTNLR
jgi:UDP-N-acetylglucosamine:LPS N-acetylglucosamine transferase